jgi:hypothetical protein
MSLHTRVIGKAARKGSLFFNQIRDEGAKFRDEADIKRVMDAMAKDFRRTYGEDCLIKFDTREAD